MSDEPTAPSQPIGSSSSSTSGSVSWFSMFRSDNYVSSMGSAFFNMMTKGFTGWLAADPFAAVAAFFNIASVFTKTNMSNMFKGTQKYLLGAMVTGMMFAVVYSVFKSWWQPAHTPKTTTATTSTAPLSPTQARQAQVELTQSLQRSTAGLKRFGMDSQDLARASVLTRLTEGSNIAARARSYQGPIVQTPDVTGPVRVISSNRPSDYLPVEKIAMDPYLSSLSNPRTTRRDILQNSAAIHGAIELDQRD